MTDISKNLVKRVVFRLDIKNYNLIHSICEQSDDNLSDFIRRRLFTWLEENGAIYPKKYKKLFFALKDIQDSLFVDIQRSLNLTNQSVRALNIISRKDGSDEVMLSDIKKHSEMILINQRLLEEKLENIHRQLFDINKKL